MINWSAVEKEALEHFQNLLRLDTTNPPGNEHLAADYLGKVLGEAGIPYETAEGQPGRTNLVARLSGGGNGLMVSSHTDVVPVEREHWTQDPFGGQVVDGWIYGRGTIDMKYMTVFGLMAVLTAKRLGMPLKRDLVFAAVADEEAGANWGSKWLVKNRPDLIEAEWCLNEVGGFTTYIGPTRVYPVQVAEKGYAWLEMTATGKPGHGSMPDPDSAVAQLSMAIARLTQRPLPMHPLPVTDRYIREIAKAAGFPASLVLPLALNPWLSEWVLRTFVPDKHRLFASVLRNTVSPNGLQAGSKVNVIPSKATVQLDGRILPGQTPADLMREVQARVGSGLELRLLDQGMPSESPLESELMKVIATVVAEGDPGARAIPYVVPGFTDGSSYSQLGIKSYGFAPLRLPPDAAFADLFHGHDERIPVDGFFWGLRTFLEVVWRFTTSR